MVVVSAWQSVKLQFAKAEENPKIFVFLAEKYDFLPRYELDLHNWAPITKQTLPP
jgi:hypothetical protein